MARQARAFWVTGPHQGEIRPERLPDPRPGELRVRTLCSAVSRGTERLVFRGGVPADQHQRMRAPFQVGDFPGPVKYGYLSVGVVEEGPPDARGRTVFCLYPHQDTYVVPAREVSAVPAGVPPSRALLAGAVETAVNALWDAPPSIGDRVSVVGAGMIGCALARLLAPLPGVRTTLVDVEPERADTASALGVAFAQPPDSPGDQDLVFHTSGTESGLRTSLEALANDGTVVELSWYGDREVRLALGGDFHSRRLAVRASQVGTLSPRRRERWTHQRRRKLALELLRDPAFDVLLTGSSPFEELPELMSRIADGTHEGICQTITYGAEAARVQPDRP